MSRCHVRCKKCDTRRVLKQQPERYQRVPACRNCGHRGYWISYWMNKRRTDARGMGCNCGGYHYIHRRGSTYCYNRKDGSTRCVGDPDFKDRWMTNEPLYD